MDVFEFTMFPSSSWVALQALPPSCVIPGAGVGPIQWAKRAYFSGVEPPLLSLADPGTTTNAGPVIL
jgi:hypothetical protein